MMDYIDLCYFSSSLFFGDYCLFFHCRMPKKEIQIADRLGEVRTVVGMLTQGQLIYSLFQDANQRRNATLTLYRTTDKTSKYDTQVPLLSPRGEQELVVLYSFLKV